MTYALPRDVVKISPNSPGFRRKKDLTLFWLERGGGYVSIPPGVYRCQMYLAPILVRDKVMNGRCLWPRGHNKRSKEGNLAGILIHKGHDPHDVLDCIAVGQKFNWGGMHKSEEAAEYIFQQMGGWAPGKSNCTLDVGNK